MKNKRQRWKYRNYRSPRTTQERKKNGVRKDKEGDSTNYQYTRKSRTGNNLPSVYDDIPFQYQRSWKKKRKKQYYEKDVRFECPFCSSPIDRKNCEVVDNYGETSYYCSRTCCEFERMLSRSGYITWWLMRLNKEERAIWNSMM
jgi:hypothetical protein